MITRNKLKELRMKRVRLTSTATQAGPEGNKEAVITPGKTVNRDLGDPSTTDDLEHGEVKADTIRSGLNGQFNDYSQWTILDEFKGKNTDTVKYVENRISRKQPFRSGSGGEPSLPNELGLSYEQPNCCSNRK